MMRTLTPALSVIIAILLFFFITDPKLSDISALQKQIGEYNAATEQYMQFTTTLEEKLSVKRNRSVSDNNRLEQMIAQKVDDTRLLVDLEAMAKSHSMLFGNVSVDSGSTQLKDPAQEGMAAAVEVSDLGATDIEFGVIGTYDQFKELLRDIENSLTLLEVVKVSFAQTDGPFQQFTVTVRAYGLSE